MNQDYVLGFVFNNDKSEVALMRKTKPEWQKGRLNGIGGKIESGETPIEAMHREFREETGFETNKLYWREIGCMSSNEWFVYILTYDQTFDDLSVLKTVTEEPITIVKVSDLDSELTISNIPWLVRLAKDTKVHYSDIKYL
jgi:8-oxo-dGTP diphosphatase